MARKQEVEIIITPEGQVKIKVGGVAGGACLLETARLEKVLGKVVRRENTPEFYQQAPGVAPGLEQKNQ